MLCFPSSIPLASLSTNYLPNSHLYLHRNHCFSIEPKVSNPNLMKCCCFFDSSNFRLTNFNASKPKRKKRSLLLSCLWGVQYSRHSFSFNCNGEVSELCNVILRQNYGGCCAKCGNLRNGFAGIFKRNVGMHWRSRAAMKVDEAMGRESGGGEERENYDAIVIGSGIGGLVAATQLAVKGAKVLVLEKYVIPGGSSGFYQKDGYTFDVGSSVMFGFSDKGNLNLITQSLAAVGCKMEVIPDPTTVHFHLPSNLSVRVHREYNDFMAELITKFPDEKDGLLKFYGECWKMNIMSIAFTAYFLPQNAGAIARKYIKDPQLLSFIDAEVLCDRHFGGINYPVGGVGRIAKSLAQGLVNQGSKIQYKANVVDIILEHGKAVGVRLSDGTAFYAQTIISNATRWDTFGKLLKAEKLPKEEEDFQKLYVKAPSFLSIHMAVKAEVLPPDTDCHHFVLESDWKKLEEPYGSIFLSIPTILDSSLAPSGHHILHIFTISSIDDWQGLSPADYNTKKELIADEIISRLEKNLFPGLKSSIIFKEAIDGLYCVGDSCFPGQGVIAVAFSGIMCAHRVAADIGIEKSSRVLDAALLRLLRWFRTLA
ncbi:Prolycopene isomerase chloroplastic [Bienertia sinuspersici]